MATSKFYIRTLNRVIEYGINKDIFDFDECFEKYKEMYPRSVPTKKKVRTLLNHSAIKAKQENGHYVRIKGV